MKVLITGSSGLVGSVLTDFFIANNNEVIRLLRKSARADSPVWDPENGEIDLAGGQEVKLPALQPAELWKESGRMEAFQDILFTV